MTLKIENLKIWERKKQLTEEYSYIKLGSSKCNAEINKKLFLIFRQLSFAFAINLYSWKVKA